MQLHIIYCCRRTLWESKNYLIKSGMVALEINNYLYTNEQMKRNERQALSTPDHNVSNQALLCCGWWWSHYNGMRWAWIIYSRYTHSIRKIHSYLRQNRKYYYLELIVQDNCDSFGSMTLLGALSISKRLQLHKGNFALPKK